MAFCTKCGRELIQGQVCVCQRNYSENSRIGQTENAAEAEQRSTARIISQNTRTIKQSINSVTQENVHSSVGVKEQSAALISNVFEVLLAILKAPVTAGRKIVKEGKIAIGISLIILQAVFTGLFAVIIISKINELVAGAAGSRSKSLLEYASVSVVKLSYLRGFLVSIFGSAALSFIVALIAMLLLMLFRGKTTYTSMLIATGVRCAGMMPVTILAIVVSLLNVSWGIVIFMVSTVMGYIFMGRVLTAGSVFLENRVPYVVFFLVILTVVVQCFMIAKIWPLYLPDVLRASYYDFLRQMKSGSSDGFTDLLEDIFY